METTAREKIILKPSSVSHLTLNRIVFNWIMCPEFLFKNVEQQFGFGWCVILASASSYLQCDTELQCLTVFHGHGLIWFLRNDICIPPSSISLFCPLSVSSLSLSQLMYWILYVGKRLDVFFFVLIRLFRILVFVFCS